MPKILVVSSFFFVRQIFSQALQFQDEFLVLKAKDYDEFLFKLKEKPDIIFLGVALPNISSLDILTVIKEHGNLPVIIIAPENTIAGDEAITALLDYGALDIITKPSKIDDLDILKKELLEKIKNYLHAKGTLGRKIITVPQTKKAPRKSASLTKKLLVIGASSGGPFVVEHILQSIPASYPHPVLVVQHMPPQFAKSFAARLNKRSALTIKAAQDGELLEGGKVLIAPGQNIEIQKRKKGLQIKYSKKRTLLEPSIDLALHSLENIKDLGVIVVILTGMGQDGLKGVEALKKNKAIIITQDKESSPVYGMPRAIAEAGFADYILPDKKIVDEILRLI